MKHVLHRITAGATILTLLEVGLFAQEKAPDTSQKTPDDRLGVVLDLERPSSTDILLLRNGDKLTGTVLNDSFSLRTSYAKLKLNNRMIAGIDLEGGTNNIESIITVNNNRFSGFLDDPVFVFKLQTGPQIEVRREKVLKAVFRVREAERQGIPQSQFLVLKNGDYFSGRILNDQITVATTYAKVPINLKNAESITMIGRDNPLTKIVQRNGDILQGVLETEDIEVALDVGIQVKIYQDRFEVIYCRQGFIPDLARIASRIDARLPKGWERVKAGSSPAGSVSKVRDPRTGITFILVQPGTFRMGSPAGEKGREDDEGPVHEVEITKPFYLGVTEVTQAQWQRVMGSNPSNWKGDDLPVEQVSWEDAMEFCRKAGYRLPTEAEWEYACRAGSTTRFSFGDADGDLGAYAWNDGNSEKRTHPVGQKKPNAWGFFDMHGNVWEWCADWYAKGYYGQSPRQDPHGPSSGSRRVLRGGSWYYSPRYCRSAFRSGSDPSSCFSNLGLRVARTP